MIADAHNLLRVLTTEQQRVLAAAAHFYVHLLIAEETVFSRLEDNSTHLFHKYYMLHELVFWLARMAFDHIFNVMLETTFHRHADDITRSNVQTVLYKLLMAYSEEILLFFPPSGRADRDIPFDIVNNCPCKLHTLFTHMWAMFLTEFGLHGPPQIKAFLHHYMPPVQFSKSFIVMLQEADAVPRATTMLGYFQIIPSEEWITGVAFYTGSKSIIFDKNEETDLVRYNPAPLDTLFRVRQTALVPTNDFSFSNLRLLQLPRQMRGIDAPTSMEALVEVTLEQYPSSLAIPIRAAHHALCALEYILSLHPTLFPDFSHGLARLFLQARLCQLAKNIALHEAPHTLSVPRLMSMIVEPDGSEDWDFSVSQRNGLWAFHVGSSPEEPFLADATFEFHKLSAVMSLFFSSTLSPYAYREFWDGLVCDTHDSHVCHLDFKCFDGGKTDLVYFRARSLAGIPTFQTMRVLTPPPAHKRLASHWSPDLEIFFTDALEWDLTHDMGDVTSRRDVARTYRARALSETTRRVRSSCTPVATNVSSTHTAAHGIDDNAIPRQFATDARLKRATSSTTQGQTSTHREPTGPPFRFEWPQGFTPKFSQDSSMSSQPSLAHIRDTDRNQGVEALLEEYSHLVYVESLPEPPSIPPLLPLSPVQPVDTNAPPSTDNDT